MRCVNKNILVTGANGMIGKELVRILKDEHSPRYISDIDLPEYDLRDRIEFLESDIADEKMAMKRGKMRSQVKKLRKKLRQLTKDNGI